MRLLMFAAAAFVFQQVPAFIGDAGTWVDLITPFVVVGVAAWALRDAPHRAAVVALAAAVAYVDGHGIHLAANDIGHFDVTGKAEDVRHFWDENWGHLEWHLGFVGLLAALVLADGSTQRPDRRHLVAAALIGWTLFTNTVEGNDWPLTFVAAGAFAAWAIAVPRRSVVAVTVSTLFASALLGIWIAWHGGVPAFSELGWL